MKALLELQGLDATLEELPTATIVAYDNVIQKKAYNSLILCLGDRVLPKETNKAEIWKKLETLYMTKSLANRLYLKKLYTFHTHLGKSQYEHIDEFHKLVGDLAAIDTAISDEDHALLLLTYLPLSYNNFKMTEAKGDGDEGLCEGEIWSERYREWFGADEYDNVDVMMAMSVDELLDWIMDSGASYHMTYMRDYLVDFEEYDSDNILLGDGRECHVRGTGTLEKEGFTVKMRSGKIKVIKGSLVGSTQQCMKSRVAKHLGVAWIQQQNGLVEEINVTLLAKVRCFLIQSSLSKVFWTEDTTISTYLVNRSPSSVIEFKMPIDVLGFFGWLASIKEGILEPVKVKCIFLRYYKGIVGNKLWRLDDVTSKVLQGVEFEVELQEDHTFEVEPHGNVDHVAGSQEVQT
ncbi:zinc finger, CCHC-type containing protein [Tanacetum coccineum]